MAAGRPPGRARLTPRFPASAAGASQGNGQGVSQGNGQNAGSGNGTRESLLSLLNDGSQDELIAVSGIGPVLALKIVQHRPYRTEQQPLEDNVIPPSAYEALRDHLKRSA